MGRFISDSGSGGGSIASLSNVNNTSDMDKPVSTLQAAANTADRSTASADATSKANAAQAAAIAASTPIAHVGTGSTAHAAVTTASNGFMIATDKVKLDGIAAGAQPGTVTGVTGTAPIVSSGGVAPVISINAATTALAGSMSAADKTKLDGVAAGAQANVATNVAEGTRTVTSVQITSSTGTDALLSVATTALAGVMSGNDKAKLDGIASGAQVNIATDLSEGTRTSTSVPIVSSTGTDATLSVVSTTLAGVMSAADKIKLDGVATSANNYTHPANHPASIITQDTTNRFVTDAEKTAWNAKQPALGYTPVNKAGDSITGSLSIGADLTVTGSITANGDITAFSDERLKKDWSELPVNFVELLANVKNGTYTKIDTDMRHVGVSAQSLQTLLPEAIVTHEDGLLSVAYGNAALAAVIELAKNVVALSAKVSEQELQIQELINQK